MKRTLTTIICIALMSVVMWALRSKKEETDQETETELFV